MNPTKNAEREFSFVEADLNNHAKNLQLFIDLVKKYRNAQKRFMKTRDKDDLQKFEAIGQAIDAFLLPEFKLDF